ncbi:MAG: FAD/NAD(P)-binding protein [Candidatus Micrarchaeota archaeon]
METLQPPHAQMQNPSVKPVRIKKIVQETSDVSTFTLEFLSPEDKNNFSYEPGQCTQVSILGIGEAPISISSAATKGEFDISVKKLGNVTQALHRLKQGDIIGVRGPFGKPYPMSEFHGKNMLLIAGGIGMAPVRSVLKHILSERAKYAKVDLYYGARSPTDFVFKHEFEDWKKQTVSVGLTIDSTCEGWDGCVGFVSQLLERERSKLSSTNCIAVICGPPLMIDSAITQLLTSGFKKEQIYISLERMMKCGMGKCGRCTVGNQYTCIDGPVFRADKLPVE